VIEVAQWSKEVFARNLKRYMDMHDKNQKDMAEVVGVSTATFSDYINAKKYPRIDKIDILADYFGILKSDLIEDKSQEEIKEPAMFDGLSENQKKLMQFAQTVPEDKAALILKVI
jgi:transcriptional regulator with XRE-family HTH domain